MVFAKRKNLFPILAGLLVGLLVAAFAALQTSQNNHSREVAFVDETCAGLKSQDHCFPLELADTDLARMRGLSGRDSLPENSGMLFVFEDAAERCFWMKNMRFDLDIIWLDQNKKINKIDRGVSPATFPKSICVDGTKYVLEFNTEFADENGLNVGEELKF